MSKTYEHDGLAGCVARRRCRKTKSLVAIYHAEQAGLDPTGGAWAVVCEQHGTIANVETLSQARRDIAHPDEHCEQCREGLERPDPPRPFSGSNYMRNADRGGNGVPCVICGKRVEDGNAFAWLHVVAGGTRFGRPGEDADPAGDMGCHPIGRRCYKRHERALAPYRPNSAVNS